jgi:ribosomal protein S18 acetylase RimI-like enzyme
MEIIVRHAAPEDRQAAYRVSNAAFAGVRRVYQPRKTARSIRNSIDIQLHQVVALGDGVVVGMLDFWIEGSVCHLGNLAVDPEYQGRGVARRLIDFLADHGRELGLEGISAKTIRETGNVDIYLRMGFEVVGEKPADWAQSDVFTQLTETQMLRKITPL